MIIPLVGAGVDIHVPSLPAISQFFHSSQSLMQSSVTLYLIGYGIGQLLVGSLADSFGRRIILLTGTVIYVFACIGSALASSMLIFLFCRFLQGIAVAGPAISSKASLSYCFDGETLAHKSSYIVIAWSAGLILAPTLGSYLNHYFNWQACFWFLSAYASLILILSYVFFLKQSSTMSIFIFVQSYKIIK